eukprot:2489807-Amphidinium_carterae.1
MSFRSYMGIFVHCWLGTQYSSVGDDESRLSKVCVLIADAPPHGLEPTGPIAPCPSPTWQLCPEKAYGLDPLDIARDMAVHSITLYSVGCEPALSQYRFCQHLPHPSIQQDSTLNRTSPVVVYPLLMLGFVDRLIPDLSPKNQRFSKEDKRQVFARADGRDGASSPLIQKPPI